MSDIKSKPDRYVHFKDGLLKQRAAVSVSNGPEDAGNLLALDEFGGIDPSLISGAVPQSVATDAEPEFSRVTLTSDPTDPNHATPKSYVDDRINGLAWQNPVIAQVDFTTAEPVTPTLGDRYINTASGASSGTAQAVLEHAVYQWDGAAWGETVAAEGTALRDEGTGQLVNFNGTEWSSMGSVENHASLSGIQGGVEGERYHLSADELADVQGIDTSLAAKADATDLNTHISDANAHGISTFGMLLVDDATSAEARATLGLGTIATASAGEYEPSGAVDAHETAYDHSRILTADQYSAVNAASAPSATNAFVTVGDLTDTGGTTVVGAVTEIDGGNADADYTFVAPNFLTESDIDTLAKLNSILTDVDLSAGGDIAAHEATYNHALLLTEAQHDAVASANAPSGMNVFATMADLPAGGGTGDLSETDINTLAKINAILTDATLVDGATLGSAATRDAVLTSNGATDSGKVAYLNAAGVLDLSFLPAEVGGEGGSGLQADMLTSVYDPLGVAANAFARANHTGQQAISTVVGLQTSLNSKATTSHASTHHAGGSDPLSYADIDAAPAAFVNQDVTGTSSPQFARVTLTASPVDGTHAAPKSYVDSLVQGMAWQRPVDDRIDMVAAEPAAPTLGDRYISAASGLSSVTGQAVATHSIYEWNGNSWTGVTPSEGMALWDRGSGDLINFNGAEWVGFGPVTDHNNSNGLQGGSATERFHLTAEQYTLVDNLGTASTRDAIQVSSGASDMGKVAYLNASGVFDESLIPASAAGGGSIPFFHANGTSQPIPLVGASSIPFYKADGSSDNIPLVN